MEPSRSLRLLRVVASTVCLIALIVLLVLWARSHDRVDVISGSFPGVGGFEIESREGQLEILKGPRNQGWGTSSQSIEEWNDRAETMRQFNFTIGRQRPPSHQVLRVQIVVLLALFAATLVALLLKRLPRFSVRMLLLATALISFLLWIVTALF